MLIEMIAQGDLARKATMIVLVIQIDAGVANVKVTLSIIVVNPRRRFVMLSLLEHDR